MKTGRRRHERGAPTGWAGRERQPMSRRPSCQPGNCATAKTPVSTTAAAGSEPISSEQLLPSGSVGLSCLLPTGQLLVSCSLTYGLSRCLSAAPLLVSLLLLPLVQVSLNRLIGRMQSVLANLFSHLGASSGSSTTTSSSSSSSLPGGEYGCAGKSECFKNAVKQCLVLQCVSLADIMIKVILLWQDC